MIMKDVGSEKGWVPFYSRRIQVSENISEVSITNLDLDRDNGYKIDFSLILPQQNSNAWIFLEPNNERNKWRIIEEGIRGFPTEEEYRGVDNDNVALHGASNLGANYTYPSSGHIIIHRHETSPYYWNMYGEIQRDDGTRFRRLSIGAQISTDGSIAVLSSLNFHAQKVGNINVPFGGRIQVSRWVI